eukprot:5403885-Prymnesium_polylepis.2
MGTHTGRQNSVAGLCDRAHLVLEVHVVPLARLLVWPRVEVVPNEGCRGVWYDVFNTELSLLRLEGAKAAYQKGRPGNDPLSILGHLVVDRVHHHPVNHEGVRRLERRQSGAYGLVVDLLHAPARWLLLLY